MIVTTRNYAKEDIGFKSSVECALVTDCSIFLGPLLAGASEAILGARLIC